MKLSKKILVAAVALLGASALFTSCDGFGKDDFYGTWNAHYKVTEDNLLDKDDPVGDKTDKSAQLDSTVDLNIYFDGTSEKLIGSNKKFYQFRVRTDASGNVVTSTFWVGTYELKENENYTRGKLILNYMYGWDKVTESRAEELGKKWLEVENSKVAEVFEDGDYKYKYKETSDIEEFHFELGGQNFWQGYTTVDAVALKNCSWEVKSRHFQLIGTSSILSDILKLLNGKNEGDIPGGSDGQGSSRVSFASEPVMTRPER